MQPGSGDGPSSALSGASSALSGASSAKSGGSSKSAAVGDRTAVSTVPAGTVPAGTVPAGTVPASTVPASTVPASTVAPDCSTPADDGAVPDDGVAPDGDRAAAARRWLSPGHAAVLVVVTALVIGGIFLGRHTLAASFQALTSLDWGWILFAIGCEVVSLVAFGLSRRRLLRADGHRAAFGSVMAVTYASNALSMTVPFAGVQLALVFSYREFRRRGLGSAVTGWALAVSAILSTAALALLLLVGAITGGVSVATALGLAGAAIFLVPSTAVLLALRYQQIRGTLDRILARIITTSHRLFHWPPEGAAGALEDMLDRVARIRLPWWRYAEVFALSVLNWAADCGCLAATIRATGSQVPWHGLLLAYAAGAAVASAGLTPGGFALVEATLTAALVASGLTAPAALASVLAYRLISFWMIMVGGWVLMIALTRGRTGRARPDVFARGQARPRWAVRLASSGDAPARQAPSVSRAAPAAVPEPAIVAAAATGPAAETTPAAGARRSITIPDARTLGNRAAPE